MVGLPARGKTFLAMRLQRYLEWQGYRIRSFNVGGYRRKILGQLSSTSDFFDPTVKTFAMEREIVAKRCFADLAGWLSDGGIAIYDATNVTASRREYLRRECSARGFEYLFLENICHDPAVLEKIVALKIRNSDDYRDRDFEAASTDFLKRIKHYESVYETVGAEGPIIRFFDFGGRVERGFSPGKPLFEDIAYFMGGVNLAEKDIFITRHGETFFNLEDRVGGDSSLTENGREYALRLSRSFRGRDLVIFTSRKIRTIETAAFFDCEKVGLEELNEINSGICDSMTYAEVAKKHPEISCSRNGDKFNFRYPQGESYGDLIQRVRRAIVKIEAQKKDVLVIAHRAVNRCLFSYFIPTAQKDIPYLDMPLNRVTRIYHDKALYGHEDIPV